VHHPADFLRRRAISTLEEGFDQEGGVDEGCHSVSFVRRGDMNGVHRG
jgi:hypothetical protein